MILLGVVDLNGSIKEAVMEITFILPYNELKGVVNQVFNEHPKRKMLKKNIHIINPENLKTVRFHGDAIIARGITATLLREDTQGIPLIEIPVTGYDIIRAVNECTERYKTEKIACIGSSNMVYGIQNIKKILGVELKSYLLESRLQLEQQIITAAKEGAAVIGGLEVNRIGRELGIPSTIIEVGREAVRQVLDEAIRTVTLTRAERARTERFKTIMDYAYEGIIAVDSEGVITTFNKCAQELTRKKGESSIGRHIDTVLPELNLAQTLTTRKSELGNLCTIQDITVVANRVPIVVEQKTEGAIVTFENITRIQEVEGHIRKKVHEKGLIAKYKFYDIFGQSKAIKETIRFAQQYSKVNSNILIVGETGTGKELFAQSIHNMSSRQDKPFVAVNCAAIPEHLLESELFGYAEGAFTGAVKGGKQGYFALAHGGTLFLDEISELPLKLQGRLLRVLQEKEIMPIGANRVVPINVRILSATNKNLKQLAADGLFRQDLLYRLDVLRLLIPPLRNRSDDIVTLTHHLLLKCCEKLGRNPYVVSPDVMRMLIEYSWPGNVRELKNFCERLVVLTEGEAIELKEAQKVLDFEDYFSSKQAEVKTSSTTAPTLPDIQKSEELAIRAALSEANNNKSYAAKLLGIHKTTLWRKMKKHGI